MTDKKIVIRLMAETQMEKTKSAIAIFKRLKNVTRHLDRSVYSLGRAYKQKKKAIANVNRVSEKNNKKIRQLLNSSKSLKTKLKESNKLYKEHEKAVKAATRATAQFNSQMKRTAAATAGTAGIKGMQKGFGMLKSGMGVMIGLAKRMGQAMVGATLAGSYAFMGLYDEVAKIRIVMGDNFDSIDSFMDKFQEMSETSVFSAKDLAAAGFEIGAAMGNISSDELRELTDVSQTLAIASGFDNATVAAELLMATYRQFGDTTGDVGQQTEDYAAILFKAGADTALSVQDIGTAMQFVGGTAASMEQELHNVLAALGMLRNAGLSASVASTSLNMVLTNLASPSQEASQWMRRLGIEVVDASGNIKEITDIAKEVTLAFDGFEFRDKAQEFEVLTEMFGVRGARSMTIFMKNIRENDTAMQDMANSFLDIEEGFKLMEASADQYMETPQAQFKALTNTVKNLAMELGAAFLMEEAEDGKQVLAGWIQELMKILKSEGVKKLLNDIGIIMNKLATSVLPILLDALSTMMPIWMEFLDIVTEIMASDEFKELAKSVLILVSALSGTFIRMLKNLMPNIIRMMGLLNKFLPILDLLVLSFQLSEPFIVAVAIALELIMAVLAPFMPMLKIFGALLMVTLVAPLQVIVGLFQIFIKLAAQVAGFVGDLTGNNELKQFAEDMNAFDKQIADSFARINEMGSANDFELGMSQHAGSGFGGYDFQTPSSTTVNVTVEGDVKDDDTLSKLGEEVERRLQASGGYGPS